MSDSSRPLRASVQAAEATLFNRALFDLTNVFGERSVRLASGETVRVMPPDGLPLNAGRKGRERAKRGWIARLKEYSNSVFDFRGGNERWEAHAQTFTEAQIRAIHAASVSLRMTGRDDPKGRNYPLALVLGGSGAPIVMRMLHLRSLLSGTATADRHPVNIERVGLMGCQRPVSDRERTAMLKALSRLPEFGITDCNMTRAAELVQGMKTEFDTFAVAAEIILGATQSDPDRTEQTGWTQHTISTVRSLRSPHYPAMEFVLVSAPSSNPERRANTPDTYDFVRGVPELKLAPTSPVLIVNTRIYEFQRLDAFRILAPASGYAIPDGRLSIRAAVCRGEWTESPLEPGR